MILLAAVVPAAALASAARAPLAVRARGLALMSAFEDQCEFIDEMKATAKQLSRAGHGILATDESNPTAGKRLAMIGVANTPENRRAFRELLYTSEGLDRYISGAIMFDETLYQRTSDGTRFVQLLRERGILTGIKVDTGLTKLPGSDGETATNGLDGLGERCRAYRAEGASFAKWRAVLRMGRNLPSTRAIEENARSLARYASICQQNGLVPIVEPELTLGPGDYSARRAADEMERVLSTVVGALHREQARGLSGARPTASV